jgi:alkylation response protein AidB-like acyl-CoA dehydrogenase
MKVTTTTVDRNELVNLVREFVRRDVLPTVSEYEHSDTYPEPLLAKMAELGFFGLIIPEEYGGLGLDFSTFAEIQIELSQGWMSLSGVLTSHFTSAWMISAFGTLDQREALLPRMASGELRFAFSMTEPDAGSDIQAIRTTARRDGDEYVIDGRKTWTTHGRNSGAIMLIAVTDPSAQPRHRGMTAYVIEKEPGATSVAGLEIPPPLRKLGYKGIETTELVFDGFRTPVNSVLGGDEGVGNGFRYFMAGMEIGRLSVASSATGIATDAFKRAIAYAQQRETFGVPIAQHQAIQMKLAQMATRVEAARLLVMNAAAHKDTGQRADLEMGMAKLFATETAIEVAFDSMRVHGGYGYSMDFTVERLFREAPSLVLGEGSNEIQQLLIARRLLERYAGESPA